jgi:TetR/AcrR family transcriptional regulator, mexJK operon transcriptional repressor
MSLCRFVPKVSKQVDVLEENVRLMHLLDVAAEVFLDQGYEAASVGEMAKRARASKQTFYSRFPTKEELFVAVIYRKCNDLFQEASERLHANGPIPEMLRALSKSLLEITLSDDSIALYRIVYNESGRFPELGRMFYEAGPARGLDLLATYLKEQMEKKNLRDADPTIAASHYLDMTIGRFVMKALLGINPRPSEKERSKVIDSAVDVFLRAYGVQH